MIASSREAPAVWDQRALASLANASQQAALELRAVTPPSPLMQSLALSERYGCKVLLKCEHLLPSGSFKFRGAFYRIFKLSPEQLERGVVTASSGNHGAGVAMAARLRGIRAIVHASQNASPAKLEAIRRLGGELVLHEGDCLVAERAARAQADASGAIYISPYNDFDVIAGQGGAAIEMLEQAGGSIDAVALSVGGGGLMCGIGAVLAARSPYTELIAAWPANATSLLRSLEAGEAVPVTETPTISDATAGEIEPEAITIALGMALNPSPVEIPEDRIVAAMKLLAEDEHWIVEGAAGLALAGLEACRDRLQGKTVAVVLCGRNIALDRFIEAVR